MALTRTAKIAMEYPQGHWREPGERFDVDSQRDAFILERLGRIELEQEAEIAPEQHEAEIAPSLRRTKQKKATAE